MAKILKHIEASFEIVTPSFAGDADKNRAKFRLSSINGLLRYWFRAVAWPEYEDLNKVKEAELNVFGGAGSETDTKKHAFRLRAIKTAIRGYYSPQSQFDQKNKLSGINYLAGQGCIHFRNGLQRAAIKENSHFILKLQFIRPVEEKEFNLLLKAIKCLGLIGGVGSRTRRGFGSLVLQYLKVNDQTAWQAPQNVEEYKSMLAELLKANNDTLPDYTALSKKIEWKIITLRNNNTWQNALDEIGKQFLRFRSYGRHGKLPWGEKAKQRFSNDHDLVYNFCQGKKPDKNATAPERVAFGLPHNYFFSSLGPKGNVNVTGTQSERRASPLFIHIHKINNKYYPVVVFIPARFLPDREQICLKGKRKTSLPLPLNLYQPIKEFLKTLPAL